MKREFILNLLLLVFINLLIKPAFIFGIDLSVQNKVGDKYGLYFALLNLSYVFQIISDFGIQNYNSRNLSRHPHLLVKYFPNLLALKLGLSVLYVGLSLLIGLVLLGYGVQDLGLLAILLFNQVLVQLIFFLRSNVSGLGFYRWDSLLSAIDKLWMLIICAVLLWANPLPWPFSIEMFALAQTAALLIAAILAYALLRWLAKTPLRIGRPFGSVRGRAAIWSMLRGSMPYALVILLMFAYSRLDAVFLERMLPDGHAHADVYAGAYRLLDACNMFGYLFATLLLPMFARLLKEGGLPATQALLSLGFRLIWAGSVTLAAAVFFAREPLVQLMMPERASSYRWDTLGILIWVFVPVSVIYIFSTLLTAHERLMQMNRFFIWAIGIDVLLNMVLTPRWQAHGAAMATLVTHSFVALSVAWLCVVTLDLKPRAAELIKVAGFALSVCLLDWVIFQFTPFHWSVQMGFALLTGVVASFVFGMISLRGLGQFRF